MTIFKYIMIRLTIFFKTENWDSQKDTKNYTEDQ